ncbi:MAG: glutamine--fructose-6-phosphate transaminase (isomerizing) [Chloroflexi bacterium]|nr:glutamine--fructose-6-phosphate transaminase (isomerizing) [Chloroflexota bacterium]
MCGIFGYVGARHDASQIVLHGLKQLEYRGYDSWGIAVPNGERVLVEKRTGKIGQAETSLPTSTIGLGHTRWATHGGVTDTNAHPHLDCSGRLAIIHNGIVQNHRDLRRELRDRGHTFRSETDTEVIAHLLEDELAATPASGVRLVSALMATFRRLEGLNAIAALDIASASLAAAKSGSPLTLGWAADGALLASDYSALLEHTRQMTFLDENQAAQLSPDGIVLYDVTTGAEIEPVVTQVEWAAEQAELQGFPDFMSKEIQEQPHVLRRIARERQHEAAQLAQMIREAQETHLVGCGTAAHAALAGQYLLARVAGRRAFFANGSEFAYLEKFLGPGALAVALSQSGETIDVIDSVRAAKRRGTRIAALVNVEGSTLYRLADHAILLGAGPERCVLATKSFTAKLAVMLLTAHALTGRTAEAAALIERAATEIEALLSDWRRDFIRQIAERIYRQEHLYVIGRGPSYPLALEAALKVKEVSYVHAEGFAGGELKHGVIALIEQGTPCLVLAPNDETRADILSGAMEVKARGGLIVGIGPENDDAFDLHIPVADLGEASGLVQAVPAQLLGYYLALLRGHDPDKPRNLAKSVTVK